MRMQRLNAKLSGVIPRLIEHRVVEQSADRIRVEPAHFEQAVMVERGIDRFLPHARLFDRLERLFLKRRKRRAAVFQLNVDRQPALAQQRQHILEQRRHVSFRRIHRVNHRHPAKLGVGIIRHRTRKARQAAQFVVVKDDQTAVL